MNVQNCLLNILHHYGINVYITNEKRDRFSLFLVFMLNIVMWIDLTIHLLFIFQLVLLLQFLTNTYLFIFIDIQVKNKCLYN